MTEHTIVWDLETIPDANRFPAGEADPELPDRFPKLIFHRIACIGALIASQDADGAWQAVALGAPHLGERSEKDLIQGFVDKIAELKPRLVTFNGSSFDLPVLRYRAMVNRISAPGLNARNYFNRYTDDAIDLCDVLASFDARSKVSLLELCRGLGLPGKPDGIDGTQVESYYRSGRVREIAEYCETDVVNTYRAWLRYELFRGALSPAEYDRSESNLSTYVVARRDTKAHLLKLVRKE